MKKKYPFYQMLKNMSGRGKKGNRTTTQAQGGSALQQQVPQKQNPVPTVQNENDVEDDVQPPKRAPEPAQQPVQQNANDEYEYEEDDDGLDLRRQIETPYSGRLPKFEDWKEETDAYKPGEFLPYTGHKWGKTYDPKVHEKYDRRMAHVDFNDILDKKNGFYDGRPKWVKDKEIQMRDMTKNQQDDFNQLIDITVNKKRDLKYNPKLLSVDYANKYAQSRGGWAQEIDVTPYDGRNENEIVVFNKYGIPTHVNGYSWGKSDAGVQQLYQEQYPGGFDNERKKFIPYSQWKKEQFQYTQREKPWHQIKITDSNTEMFDQLRGRGYNPPKAPAEALPVTSIWNKIVSKRIRKWLDDEIVKLDGAITNAPKEDQKEMFREERRQKIIIRDCVSLIQLSSLLFKYYMDSHFWQLIKKANVLSAKEIPTTFKEYKKLINQKDGKVNRAQYRRMFYQLFIKPPDGFRWDGESSGRAIEEADVSSDGLSLLKEVDAFTKESKDNANIVNAYFDSMAKIDKYKAQEKLTQDERLDLAEQKKIKTYCQKAMKSFFSDKLKLWNDTFENVMINGDEGEWDEESWNQEEIGDLEILNEELYDDQQGENYWMIELKDKDGKTIGRMNMAEIPEKGKGKK